MLYFDASYLVRLYVADAGWEKVRALAATGSLACSLHGKAELVAAFHRKFREGLFGQTDLETLCFQLEKDSEAGAFRWLPLTPAVVERLMAKFTTLPENIALRAADAIHLSCAAEAGFAKVYSNDTRFLAASAHFGLSGENVIR